MKRHINYKYIFTAAIFTFLLLAAANPLWATIRKVPLNYSTIQAAINASFSGDTVLVADGTYAEWNLTFNGKSIAVVSETGPVTTIIDCAHNGVGFIFSSGENANAYLAGFTIKQGNAPAAAGGGITISNHSHPIIDNCIITTNASAENTSAGGIYCKDSSPTIKNCQITDNKINCSYSGDLYGGGILLINASPTIDSCTINGNELLYSETPSGKGAGIACLNGSAPTITGNSFFDNVCNYGGGIYCDNASSPKIKNNTIYDQEVENNGAGIFCSSASSEISYNLLYNNEAGSDGGGIYIDNCAPAIFNNTLTVNNATNNGGGIYHSGSAALNLKNMIIWANIAGIPASKSIYSSNSNVTYSNVEDGWFGSGNINLDPLFVDPLLPDYHLQKGSPCIDSGDPDFDGDGFNWKSDPDDRDPDDTRLDMGAFYRPAAINIDISIPQPGEKSGNISVYYEISSTETSLGLRCRYKESAAASWTLASISGDTSNLTAGQFSGYIVWHSADNIINQEADKAAFSILAYSATESRPDSILNIHIDNFHGQGIQISFAESAAKYKNTVRFNYLISDATHDTHTLRARYKMGNQPWEPATLAEDTSGYAYADYSGVLSWTSENDLAGQESSQVRFSVIPFDSWYNGTGDTTALFNLDNKAPAIPNGLNALSGEGKIILSWQANTEVDLDHYVLYRNTSDNPGSAELLTNIPKTEINYSDVNVSPGTRYFYWISSVDNIDNESSRSASVSEIPSELLADITAAPSLLDYGRILLNQDSVQTISIGNTGLGALNVLSTDIAGADSLSFKFVSGQGSFNIAHSRPDHNIKIKFQASTAGIKSAYLKIISNDPDENPLEIPLTGRALAPDIVASANTMDFGKVIINTDSTMSLILSNNGDTTLFVSATNISGTDSDLFSFVSGQGAFHIPEDGTEHIIKIKFKPLSVGGKTATLNIISNDPDENPLEIPLTGRALAPDIVASANTLDFGKLIINTDSTMSLILSNNGDTTLFVSATNISGTDSDLFSFVSGQGAFSVPEDGTEHIIRIRFKPLSFGKKTATLNIISNDPDESPLEISLEGRTMAPDIVASDDTLNFGKLMLNTDSTMSLIVSNNGDAALSVSSTDISGMDSCLFSFVSGQGAFNIPAGGTEHIIEIEFKPLSIGEKTATLNIISDDPDENLFPVVLTGRGLTPEMPPDPPAGLHAESHNISEITLTWTANNEPDFLRYYIHADTVTMPTALLDSVNGAANTSCTIEGLLPGKRYYFRLSAVDSFGNISGYSNETSAVTQRDSLGPVLSTPLFQDTVLIGNTFIISAEASDYTGVKSMILFFRESGAEQYSEISMQPAGQGKYQTAIPAASVGEKGLEFYIKSNDVLDNFTIGANHAVVVYMPNGIRSASALPAGKNVSYYRLFSIPANLQNTSPVGFLAANSALGSYEQIHYRWYEVRNNELKEYPDIGNLHIGKGYLIGTDLKNIKLNSGKCYSVNTIVPFRISLPAGWSLIGSPFNYNIHYDSLSVSAGNFELKSFDGTWKPNSQGLVPWQGYAIRLSQAADFIINGGLAGLSTAEQYYVAGNNYNNKWLICISADDGISKDLYNFAGQDMQASDDNDKFDLHEAPRILNHTSLFFTSAHSGEEKLSADLRAYSDSGNEWNFTCSTDSRSNSLKLTFSGVTDIPEQFDAILFDVDLNTAYNLRHQSQINFLGRNEKSFKLVIGTESFVQSKAGRIDLSPRSFTLSQNFPNPFNPSTQIMFAIPEYGKVKLQVFNTRGQLVATLADGEKPAGTYNIVWNASVLATGLYYYRLQYGDITEVKKCLFIK